MTGSQLRAHWCTPWLKWFCDWFHCSCLNSPWFFHGCAWVQKWPHHTADFVSGTHLTAYRSPPWGTNSPCAVFIFRRSCCSKFVWGCSPLTRLQSVMRGSSSAHFLAVRSTFLAGSWSGWFVRGCTCLILRIWPEWGERYFLGLEEPGFLEDLSEGIFADGQFALSASDLDQLVFQFLDHFVPRIQSAFLDDPFYRLQGRYCCSSSHMYLLITLMLIIILNCKVKQTLLNLFIIILLSCFYSYFQYDRII